MNGWVIFILLGFGGGPKETCWRLTLSETRYWVSDGCQGTAGWPKSNTSLTHMHHVGQSVWDWTHSSYFTLHSIKYLESISITFLTQISRNSAKWMWMKVNLHPLFVLTMVRVGALRWEVFGTDPLVIGLQKNAPYRSLSPVCSFTELYSVFYCLGWKSISWLILPPIERMTLKTKDCGFMCLSYGIWKTFSYEDNENSPQSYRQLLYNMR